MTHVECKSAFIGLDNEVWDVRSILNQKQQKLGHSSASYGILNPHVFLLAFHLYYPYSKHIECVYYANPVDSLPCKVNLCFHDFAIGLLNHLKKNKKPISVM